MDQHARTAGVWAWRHPAVAGAAGRCIGGRSDPPIDARKAKRLAHRIRQLARRERLPRAVVTSPLRRCRDVGAWLRRFGFVHRVDARLREVDFGRWDGQRWDAIAPAEIAAWADDLAHHAPGGGESVAALLVRVDAVLRQPPAALLVTHGGWLSAACWRRGAAPGAWPTAAQWPPAPRHAARVRLA